MQTKYYDKIGEKVYIEKLSNGLTIYIVRKKDYVKKYAFFATNYGGADRRFRIGENWIDTPEGVAHFLEHKMFDTENGNALNIIFSNGAAPNAFTSSSMTAYYFNCIDNFETNFQTLLEFVSIPYFTDESVAKEQGIIGQEIAMTDDEPDYTIYFNLMKALYKNHPLRYSVAGTAESIAKITAKTLYDCHKIFYNPSNMVLCVVGDVDPQYIISKANDILPKNRSEIPQRDYGEDESASVNSPEISRSMDIGMPLFMSGYKCGLVPNGPDYRKYELVASLALDIIAGRSSPLFSSLYEEGFISKGFSAEFESVTNQSHAIFSGVTKDPHKVSESIKERVTILREKGVDHETFERIKRAHIGYTIRSYNSFENICSSICDAHFKNSDGFKDYEVLLSITVDDVNDFIRSRLRDHSYAVSTIMPLNR